MGPFVVVVVVVAAAAVVLRSVPYGCLHFVVVCPTDRGSESLFFFFFFFCRPYSKGGFLFRSV